MQELEAVLRQIVPGHESSVDVVKKVLPGGKERAEVVVTQKPVEPVKRISPPRAHTFFNAAGFTIYLSKYGGEDTVILADPGVGAMTAVLDEKAERGFEVVRFVPQLHPLFAPWNAAFGMPMSVLGLSEFLAEHRRAVIDPDGRELMLMFQQIKVAKGVTLARGVGVKSVNGVMTESKIAGEIKNIAVEVPEQIVIETPIYVETAPRRLEIDLLVAERDGQVMARMASSDVIVAKTELFEKMLAGIQGDLGSEKTVVMGCVDYHKWAFIE